MRVAAEETINIEKKDDIVKRMRFESHLPKSCSTYQKYCSLRAV